MAVLRDAKGRILPGQPALPGAGRPPIPPDVRKELDEIFRAAAPEAARKLVALMKDKDEDPRVSAMAAVHVLDRVLGRVVQNVDSKVQTTNVNQAHLQALMDQNRQTADERKRWEEEFRIKKQQERDHYIAQLEARQKVEDAKVIEAQPVRTSDN
jgi:hypothetical protein